MYCYDCGRRLPQDAKFCLQCGLPQEPLRVAVPRKMRFAVFARDGFACVYCGRKSPEVELEADHRLPVSAGGKTEIDNLVTACRDCNRGKGGTNHAGLAGQNDRPDPTSWTERRITQANRIREPLAAVVDTAIKGQKRRPKRMNRYEREAWVEQWTERLKRELPAVEEEIIEIERVIAELSDQDDGSRLNASLTLLNSSKCLATHLIDRWERELRHQEVVESLKRKGVWPK